MMKSLLLLTLLSSLLMALSQLTDFGWLALIGYVPLIIATRQVSCRRAFFLAWLAGFIQYIATLYWLMTAMTVFGHVNWFLSFLGLSFVAGVIACYIGGAAYVARYISEHFHSSYSVLFACALCAAEYLRDYGFIGAFPWGASGNSLVTVPILLQGASVVGVYGLVLYVGIINGAIASLISKQQERWLQFSALILTLALILFGCWRIESTNWDSLKKIKVALLQGNIEQGIKNQAEIYDEEILTRYRKLQEHAIAQGAELVIWPESSYPLRLNEGNPNFKYLGPLAPVNVIPAVAIDSKHDFYNSAYVLDHFGHVLRRFDKSQLVPFGEYVPWPFDSIIAKIVPNLGEFERGNNLKPVQLGDYSMAVTICYEGVFPRITRDFVNAGANLLVNVTNDAWYGFSEGPVQHLNMYKIRSVETGRSFVRATNTGYTAWIDPLGVAHEQTQLFEEAIVVAQVPLSNETTIYAQIGDLLPKLTLLFLALSILVIRRPRLRSDWLWALFGLGIIFGSQAYFEPAKLALQEDAFTKDSCFIILGLILGLRLWKSSHLKNASGQ